MNNKKISFRDPSGLVFVSNGKIIRAIHKSKKEFYKKLFNENWYKILVEQKKIQLSTIIDDSNNILDDFKKKNDASDYFFVEHKKFNFPIFARARRGGP